jgi:acetyltransferase EpsM
MIAIIGAGDGGREALDILERAPCVFVDDDASKHGQLVNGHKVVGGLEWLKGKRIPVVCSVHDPQARREIVGRARSLCLARWGNVISAHAVVAPSAKVGGGTIIYPGAVVGTAAHLGNHCIIDKGATLSHDVSLFGFCTVCPGAHLAGHVTCDMGAFIGMGACVLPGVTIGQHAVVGAGAVVLKDVLPGVTVAGVPARIVRGGPS